MSETSVNCTCGNVIGRINSTAARTCSNCKRVWDYPRLLQLIAVAKRAR